MPSTRYAVRSSNFGSTRAKTDVELLVIHAMAEFILAPDGYIEYAPHLLETSGESAHWFVTPTGDVLEGIDPGRVAWHARGHNTHSIGIELLVPGVHDWRSFRHRIRSSPWMSMSQWHAAKAVAIETQMRFPLVKMVAAHSQLDPQRKEDPGPHFPLREFAKTVELTVWPATRAV